MNHFACPACGFGLQFEPWSKSGPSDEICPSCGIQFGYDDAAGGKESARPEIYRRWRENWIAEGMAWHGDLEDLPDGWQPEKQLIVLGLPSARGRGETN